MSASSFTETIPDSLRGLVSQLDQLSQLHQTHPIPWEEEEMPNLEAHDFRLIDRIGRGGMGTVYLAEQISLARRVAVKVLASQLVKAKANRDLFKQEAKFIAMLHHPGIIKVLSAGEEGACCYYAMEYIDGTSLDQWTFPSQTDLLDCVIQIADALAYAHRCGILHRDIKPANIFLDSVGRAHIGDFGIAHLMASNTPETEPQSLGTPDFMPPEIRQNARATLQADIYSFGATLKALKLKDGLQMGRDFEAICRKCTEEKPENRFPSMDAVAEDLRHLRDHEPVSAANPTVLRRLALWGYRNPILGTLALLALLGTAGWGIRELSLWGLRLQARHELAQLVIPTETHPSSARSLEVKRILDHSERILGRFPDDPEIVSRVLELHQDYIQHQANRGRIMTAIRETDRLISILEILFWNPNISEQIREHLLELQISQIQNFSKHQRGAETLLIKEKIQNELQVYHGDRRDEFLKAFEELKPIFDAAEKEPQKSSEKFFRGGGRWQHPRKGSAGRTHGRHER